LIGERKTLDVNFNLDSQTYYTGSTVKVRGLVKDVDGDYVSNATVRAYVKNTLIKLLAVSDNNGVFSFEFQSPTDEGNYTLALSAEDYPYIYFNSSKVFNVFKSREISIITPDNIKIKQSQNMTQEFSITNVGQADLLNLNITLDGIPKNYYNLTSFIEKLKPNEENKVYAYFSIPANAEKNVYSASLSVFNDEIKQVKIFGITITGNNETENVTAQTPAGNFILPKLDYNIVYVIAFAVLCFSSAIVLKKRKIKNSKRSDIKDSLFDVKGYLRKRKSDVLSFRNDYRDLISAEFPLKNKDKYGKNN
jgi:hypothetical protein